MAFTQKLLLDPVAVGAVAAAASPGNIPNVTDVQGSSYSIAGSPLKITGVALGVFYELRANSWQERAAAFKALSIPRDREQRVVVRFTPILQASSDNREWSLRARRRSSPGTVSEIGYLQVDYNTAYGGFAGGLSFKYTPKGALGESPAAAGNGVTAVTGIQTIAFSAAISSLVEYEATFLFTGEGNDEEIRLEKITTVGSPTPIAFIFASSDTSLTVAVPNDSFTADTSIPFHASDPAPDGVALTTNTTSPIGYFYVESEGVGAELSIGRPTLVYANTGVAGTTGFTATAPTPAGGTSPYAATTFWYSNSHDHVPGVTMTQIATPSGGPWFLQTVQGRGWHMRLRATDNASVQANSAATTGYIPYWRPKDGIYCFGDSHMANRRTYLEAAFERALGAPSAQFLRVGFEQSGANSTEFLAEPLHTELLDDVAADFATLAAGGKLWIINGVGFNDQAAGITFSLSVTQQLQLAKDMVDEVGAANVAAIVLLHTFPGQELAGDSTKILNLNRITWDKGSLPAEQGRQYTLNQLHGTSYLGVPIIVPDHYPYEYLVNNQAAYTGDGIHPSTAAYTVMADLEAYSVAPFIRKVLRGESLGATSVSGGGGAKNPFTPTWYEEEVKEMAKFADAYPVTPSDTAIIPIQYVDQAGITVGGIGTVVIDTPQGIGRTITFTETGLTGLFPCDVVRVKAASTATDIKIMVRSRN
jgi:lysophospholipase L1-like esterase